MKRHATKRRIIRDQSVPCIPPRNPKTLHSGFPLPRFENSALDDVICTEYKHFTARTIHDLNCATITNTVTFVNSPT